MPYFYFLNLDISDISLLIINWFIHVHLPNFNLCNLASTVLSIQNELLRYKKPNVFIKLRGLSK